MKTLYKVQDCGCYIDGSVPRTNLEIYEKVLSLFPLSMWAKVKTPNIESYDDGEIDGVIADLTEKLYDITAPDLVWFWEAGDLILCNQLEME